MNKAYLFIQGNLQGVGGAQMYAITKSRWLRNNGWNACVLYARGDQLSLNYEGINLKKFDLLPASPAVLPKHTLNKALSEICSWLNNFDDVVIETNVIDFSVWGELIAEMVGGVHFIFSLGENPPLTSNQERAFYWKKYERNEFASITVSFLDSLFLKHEQSFENAVLLAYEGDAVADVKVSSELVESNSDFTIGLVSRLEKSFVLDAARGMASFASSHPDKSIRCVFVGGDGNKTVVSAISELFNGCTNVKLVFTGELYPIPYRLIKSFDVAIAKAGCVRCCLDCDVLTIKYQIDNDIPQGVVCYDMPLESVVPARPGYKLEDYLNSILIKGAYKNLSPKYLYKKINVDFAAHEVFLQKVLTDRDTKSPKYLTSCLPKPHFIKAVLAAIASVIGKYPDDLRMKVRKVFRMS